MYKVFINEKIICFIKKTPQSESEHIKIHQYKSKKQLLTEFIAFVESNEKKILLITGKKEETLFKKFKTGFKIIHAAGGLVKNQNNQFLFIFRNARWDLPKGKSEFMEPIEKTAIREVNEECGTKYLEIIKPLNETYHIYFNKDKWVLKCNHWFEMISSNSETLIPQTEEGISIAKWFDIEQIPHLMENSFPSISELVSDYFGFGKQEADLICQEK